MSNADSSQTRIDYPKRLWETASTLSSSAQSIALRKVRELGLDEEQGEITLEETLMNLSATRDVLLDTVERGRLPQLPLKLQSRLLQETTKVSNALVELSNGKDTLRILENAVEDLNATIWQLNLQNQSEGVLGFERKMNELKAQEVLVKRSMRRADRLSKRSEEFEVLIARIYQLYEHVKTAGELASHSAAEIDGLHERIGATEAQAKATLTVVKEYEAAIAKSSAEAIADSTEISTLSEDASQELDVIAKLKKEFSDIAHQISLFRAEHETALNERIEKFDLAAEEAETRLNGAIDQFNTELDEKLTSSLDNSEVKLNDQILSAEAKLAGLLKEVRDAEEMREAEAEEKLQEAAASFSKELNAATQKYDKLAKDLQVRADGTIESNNSKTVELTTELANLEGRIRSAIEKATGYTLFHSFQKRQEDLKKSTRYWSIALGVGVLISIGLTLYLIRSLPGVHEYRIAFFVKLSLSLPIVFALTFCSIQYTRERRLEEEYAFKSSISISLDPYQRLVQSVVDMSNPEERAKYTAFMISSINKVFTSPTGLVFDEGEDSSKDAGDLLKTAGDVTKELVKAKLGK